MSKIKFGDIKVGQIAKKHIADCIDNNWFTMGEKVALLEKKFAEKIAKGEEVYACAVNSGTTACFLAALSLYDIGAQKNDEVIVPALSFIATTNAVWAANFQPRFCDIRRETLNMNEELVENLIGPNTRAIFAVNTMGRPCKMDVLREIADKHKLLLICDNCEGHLSKYKGKPMEYWADICVYSCYTAHLMFSVEFGFITTKSKKMLEVFQSLRNHGRDPNSLIFEHYRIGWNGKPTDIHAAVGLEQIESMDEVFEIRIQNLKWMIKQLEEENLLKYFWVNDLNDPDYHCCPHALSLTFKPDLNIPLSEFYNYLEQNGIQCKLNFKCIPTQQPAYRNSMRYDVPQLSEAEYVGNNGLHVACHQYLTTRDMRHIITTIRNFLKLKGVICDDIYYNPYSKTISVVNQYYE